MNVLVSLFNSLPGAAGQGLIWGIMAIGVYITYKILDVADLTVDGSLATGGAVAALCVSMGWNPWLAVLAAVLAGMLAGLATGVLHTACGIPAILAGILTQLALYSINLRIMAIGDENATTKATLAVSVDKNDLLLSSRYVREPALNNPLLLLVLLTAVVLFATGIAGSSVAALKDLTDTARIALLPGSGWPQQTGVAELEQVAPLTGSFVELGDEGCVVWSRTGKKLNSIQSGYARPALAAGKTRFVLYNRSGNELRVESRTQNLYTKQLENSIFLCAMSDNGTLAVVTEDQTSMAKLLVYSPSMEQQLSWSMTSNDGTPLRMAFSPDSRKLAAAAVTVSGGQVMTNLYLINLASGDPVSLVNQGGVPQWLGWTSASTILAVYDTRAVLYNAGGGERAVYDFAGTELKDVSVDAAGNVALLLASGQVSQAVTLDKNLNVQFSAAVSAANSIVRAGNLFYLLADNAVECFDASGAQQWSQNLDTSPQALLANSKDLLLFSGNTVQKLEAPAE